MVTARTMRPGLLLLVIGALARAGLFAAEVPSTGLALTNVRAVLDLSAERAALGLPVELSAAVTLADAASGMVFIQDDSGGIFVSTSRTVPALRRGEIVEVRGRSDAGLHLPAINDAAIQPTGRIRPLKAARPPLPELVQGKFDCEFVEVRGVVRSVGENRGRASLLIETGDGPPIEVTFLGLTRTNLWDATVRVRGVCGLRGMKGGRVLAVILYCWSNESVTVETPGLPDPFAAPASTFTAMRRGERRRVRIDGRITRLGADLVTVQDEAGEELEVEVRRNPLLRHDDRVQVSGVPDESEGRPAFRHVELRAMAPTQTRATNANAEAPLAPVITRLADVRKLGEAAAAEFPVRVRATVTYYDAAHTLFVQDDTAGIYIQPGASRFDVKAGQWLELEGFTHAGDYAPVLRNARVRVLEDSTLPAPKYVLPEILFRGQHDSLRVDVAGVVTSVRAGPGGRAEIELGTTAGRITTHLLLEGTNLPLHLVDADVRVRGVCGSTFNQRRQFTAPVLYVAATNDIIIERPAPADPFAIELQPVSGLLKFDSSATHRAKISGTVTLIHPRENYFCLQDATGGAFVRVSSVAGLRLGNAAEAVGFPVSGGYTPGLMEARFRVLGHGPFLVPRAIGAHEALSGRHDSECVVLKARLLDRFARASNDVLVLKAENVTFEAHLPRGTHDAWMQKLEPRSMLALTGVCVVAVNTSSDPHAFKLLLRTPADVRVLSAPPLWQDDRVRAVALWSLALIITPVIWVALLRRKVREQTAIISAQLTREQDLNDELERKVRERTVALSDANAQLQQAHDGLEARVHKRTAELSHANETLRAEVLERQRSEHALRLSEERFAKAFRCSPVPMAISTMADGHYIDLNDAYAQMLGFTRDEMLGRTSVELGVWVDLDDRLRAIQTMREKRRICDWRLKLHSKSGETRHVLASAEIIVVNGLECLLAILNDETQRVLLEDQLRQAQKMEAVGQLAAGIAHDFNNMLTIIQGHVCLMLATHADAEQAESLREISRTADRAAHLTRQLLTFSRRQPLSPRLWPIDEVVDGMAQMLHRTLGEQVLLDFRCDAPDVTIHADRAMIEQMLLNLAVNARDAMPSGGKLSFATTPVRITDDYVRSRPDARAGEFVRITVSDTGCGMDAATLSRAFEPFFTTKDVGKGTGLGLASVYGSVKQHGGWIEVESCVGVGTTFRIFLPVQPAETTAPEEGKSAPRIPRGHETILLVEDERGVRNLARNVLQRAGYKVLCAEDGVEALTVWREHASRIDLLLTDMVMPNGLNGRELAKHFLNERSDLKVIYTSGYTLELEGGDGALQDGVNFLPKPYAADQLASIVRRCLDAAPSPAAAVPALA